MNTQDSELISLYGNSYLPQTHTCLHISKQIYLCIFFHTRRYKQSRSYRNFSVRIKKVIYREWILRIQGCIPVSFDVEVNGIKVIDRSVLLFGRIPILRKFHCTTFRRDENITYSKLVTELL